MHGKSKTQKHTSILSIEHGVVASCGRIIITKPKNVSHVASIDLHQLSLTLNCNFLTQLWSNLICRHIQICDIIRSYYQEQQFFSNWLWRAVNSTTSQMHFAYFLPLQFDLMWQLWHRRQTSVPLITGFTDDTTRRTSLF